jgi:hypothetical protein
LAPPVLACEPTTLTTGETAVWRRSVSDFPASEGWNLAYHFAGAAAFTASAEAESDASYLVTLAAVTTESLAAGTYPWVAYATRGEGASLERYRVDSGVLVLTANPAGADGSSQQLLAEQMVAAIEARLSGRLEVDLESYGQAGRQAQLIPYDRLAVHLGIWKAKLWRYQNPGKSGPTRAVRFVAG